MLGDEAFTSALARGQSMRLDDVVALALSLKGTADGDAVRGHPSDGTSLSRRERAVAVLIAGGNSNRVIADRLVISERTVETHVHNIRRKLGC